MLSDDEWHVCIEHCKISMGILLGLELLHFITIDAA